MKVEREIKMELTFDNLVNYIINEEFEASKKNERLWRSSW